jgi:hypothetical protein
MDSFTKVWWDMRRLKIITRRSIACVEASGTESSGVAGGASGNDGFT